LEKGEYDKLPGEVYAKGFIKNYGNFLELNGEELVRKFIMEISPAPTPVEVPQPENPKPENKISAKNISQKYTTPQNADEDSNTNQKKYFVAAVALIIILIGGIIYNFGGSENKPVEVAQKNNPAAVETPTPTPQPPVQSVTPPPEPVTLPTDDSVNLQASFSDDCWTRVIVDGNLKYEGMINAGETFDWKGTQSVTVLLGNAGAAQFVMNGQNLGAIGNDGEVVEHNFTFN
jgi:cytoskeletal protein RodZ